jgi:hypothetical protein
MALIYLGLSTMIGRGYGMIDTLGLGLKGGLLLAVGLAVAYLVFTWLRLRKITKRKGKAPAKTVAAKNNSKEQAPAAPVVDDEEEDEILEEVTYGRPRSVPSAPARSNPMTIDPGFAALLGESQDRSKVRAQEVDALRNEVATLRQNMQDLQGELDRVKAAQTVSPLYNEAVGMAQHGIDAEGIASRCGISIAEAQLVAALSNKRGKDDSAIDDLYEDDYGTERHYGRKEKQYAAA